MIRRFIIGLAFVCFATQQAWAESQPAFHTPPSQLDSLSQSQLNEFGLSLANEAFATHSRVGSPSGQIGGTANMTDPNAVADVKAMFDEDALIQLARLNYGLTKATHEPNDVDDFTITDMVISRPSDEVLVASFNVALPNRVDLNSGIILMGKVCRAWWCCGGTSRKINGRFLLVLISIHPCHFYVPRTVPTSPRSRTLMKPQWRLRRH